MVLGTEAIDGIDGMPHEPAENLVTPGDYIIAMDGEEIRDKSRLVEAVENLEDEEVILTVLRSGEAVDLKVRAVLCEDHHYKLGIWVRDNAQGLGTITFLNAGSQFGALGHGIHDVDTNTLLETSGGTVYETSIKDVQKGTSGSPAAWKALSYIIIIMCWGALRRIQRRESMERLTGLMRFLVTRHRWRQRKRKRLRRDLL